MFKFFFSNFIVIVLFLCGCGENNYNLFKPIVDRTSTKTVEVINMNAESALRNNNYETAKSLYKQAIDQDSSNMDAITGYAAAVIRTPELIKTAVEVFQKTEGDTTIANINVDISRVYEMNQGLTSLLTTPGVIDAIKREKDPQVNMDNSVTLVMAAAVTLADNSALKTALGITGGNIDISKLELSEKCVEALKKDPGVKKAVKVALSYVDVAYGCAQESTGEFITPQILDKINNAIEELRRFLN